jgi:hypothetical protein
LTVVGRDREQLPSTRHALEVVHAALGEADSGAEHKVFDRPRDEHLACLRGVTDARRDMNGDPGEVIANQLAFAGVKTSSYLDPEVARLLADCASALDRPRWTVEAGEETISGLFDLATPEAPELRAHHRVVALAQLPPSAVAELGGTASGGDDVREQDSREHPVGPGTRTRTG